MVKSQLTALERSVMDESNWRSVGDLASTILKAATANREKLVGWKAAVARDHGAALRPDSGGIWVQLELPFSAAPAPVYRDPRGNRMSRSGKIARF